MTGVLGFALACAAVAFSAGGFVSLPAWALATASRRLPLPAARRADLALFAGVLPGLVAAGVLAGVATPSLLDALGVRPDHCGGHDHHVHLCVVHAATIPARLAGLGALAAVVLAVRAGAVFAGLVRMGRRLSALERLGRVEGDVVRLPGSPRLCHAVGLLRPRVLVSDSLARAVAADQLAAALSHERAHLRRRDPLALALLTLASFAALPWVARAATAAFREAAEEAADADAARAHGAVGVAEALLSVARLQTRLPLLAFGGEGLERRVRALLADAPAARGYGPGLVLAGTIAGIAAAVLASEPLHHAVETLLG
ncbi:MAG: M56 family metallopeptidase [Myxococcota bacterium]